MLASQSVIDDLVRKLNATTDVPIFDEGQEEVGIRYAVEAVAPHVPDYVLQFMEDAMDGLSDDEVELYRTLVIEGTLKKFDIRGVPKFVERQVVTFVVDGILEYAMKGSKKP